jgi:hypothetical protein
MCFAATNALPHLLHAVLILKILNATALPLPLDVLDLSQLSVSQPVNSGHPSTKLDLLQNQR